jgi:hypothetical protein
MKHMSEKEQYVSIALRYEVVARLLNDIADLLCALAKLSATPAEAADADARKSNHLLARRDFARLLERIQTTGDKGAALDVARKCGELLRGFKMGDPTGLLQSILDFQDAPGSPAKIPAIRRLPTDQWLKEGDSSAGPA